MTKDEALRLALEALQDRSSLMKWQKAINAVEAALEANNKFVDFYGYCPICNAKGLSRERHPNGSDVCTNGHIYESKYALTTPPQRTWVGLTDEEVTWICNTGRTHEQTWGMFVRTIEAKLKEKNT